VLPVLEQVMRLQSLVAQEKGLELTYVAEENCVVSATQDEVHQVIYNLTDNALKYSSEGTVSVVLKKFDKKVILTVEDQGPGIPEEDLERVFDRFFRVDKARSRAAGGTGLGLSIVSDTVRRRGGTVWAKNRPEGGAVFTVQWNAVEGGGAV
jgi:signal transduction histidine kinase